MKKTLIIFLMLFLSFPFLGCRSIRIRESGYYQYKIQTENPDGDHVVITGLTESGKEQDILIIPEEIEGLPVLRLGKETVFIFYGDPGGRFYSESLKRVYVGGWVIDCVDGFFLGCPNLEKIFILQNHDSYYLNVAAPRNTEMETPCGVFYPRIGFPNLDTEKVHMYREEMIANITYYWNYPDSPGEGVYFIDDYEGTVIGMIPPSPSREGFVFSGWFMDSECREPWDFCGDLVPARVIDEEEEYWYQGIELFAKWDSVPAAE